MSVKTITKKKQHDQHHPNANSVEAMVGEEAKIVVDKNYPSKASNFLA